MPYPNEHSCRLRDPSDFQPDSMRRMTRKHEGKEYHIIVGRLKGQDTMTEQAYRYPKDTWTEAQARQHCKEHEGKLFEPAKTSETNEIASQPTILRFSETVPVKAMQYDNARKVWPVLAIEAGCGANRCYPEELLIEAVPQFEGLKVYDNHAKEGEDEDHRDPADMMGYLTNPRFEERLMPSGKVARGIFADFHITNPIRAVECQDDAYRRLVQFSLSAVGDRQVEVVDGEPRETVVAFTPKSVDMVFGAAQGGQFAEQTQRLNEERSKELNELKQRVARLETLNRVVLTERVVEKRVSDLTDLPDATKKRITETVVEAVRRDPKVKLDEVFEKTVEAERNYLKETAQPGRVIGGLAETDLKGLRKERSERDQELRGMVRESFGLETEPIMKQEERSE